MSDSNRITFYVPVHVLQSDVVEPGLTRFLNFELSIGGDVSFSDVVELIIEEFEQPEVVHTPTVTSVSLSCFSGTVSASMKLVRTPLNAETYCSMTQLR